MKLQFPLPHTLRIKAMVQPWEASVTGPDQTRMAKRAEALGYDMISIPEHFLIPQAHVELSGPHYFHSTVAQAHIAGATSTIRINSALTILPLHDPIVLAKGLATADWLSGGRITATFGVGWLKEEFDLLDVPFHERGRMADEYCEAMIALWTQESPEYDGRYVSFRDVAFEPKPVQRPHLPIWMGGDSDAALRRTARFASGWMPFLTKPEDLAARIDFIKAQPPFDGRDFEVSYGLATSRLGEGHVPTGDPAARTDMNAQELVDRLGWLAEQGVTMSGVPIPPVADIAAYLDHAQWVIEEVKPRLPF